MKIVVVGGTGLIGSKVVSNLTAQGHQTVAAAPSTGVNTVAGQGLAEVLNSRSNCANESNTLSVSRPIEVVVLNCWVTATKET